MTTLEIILMIIGAIIFIASFIVPESKSEMDEIDWEPTQEQIQEMLKEEMKTVRSQVEDTVEETVSYSMEKTERALERMTNEKITAVSEYTQTVMTDIHKSHEEVMFLYDMLNDKHENLKETASEVSQKVKEVSEAVQEADQAKKEISEAAQALDVVRQNAGTAEKADEKEPEEDSFRPLDFAKNAFSPIEEEKKEGSGEAMPDVALYFDAAAQNPGNSNERILELHRKGKSNVAIAKELGLGVGEVKLVIDLFKGI